MEPPKDTPLQVGRLVIRKISRPKLNKNKRNILFDPNSVEDDTIQYDFNAPGYGESETLLSARKPKLLAYKNSISTARPQTVKKSLRKPIIQYEQETHPFIASTIMTKRPLSPLKKGLTVIEKQQIEEENEQNTISFPEDPVAYFSRRKDGSGHLFIYLVYAKSKSDLDFNPYDLVKTTASQIGNEYFTMSARGVTHIMPDGTTQTFTLDDWTLQKAHYNSLRKLKFFSQYFQWKHFQSWRFGNASRRFQAVQQMVKEIPYFDFDGFANLQISIINTFVDSQRKTYMRQVLNRHLLVFNPQSKYSIKSFAENVADNNDVLISIYKKYIDEITRQILELDSKIRDPKLLFVKDDEVKQMKRRNPNLGQLLVLEKKKAEIRVKRTERVNAQIMKFADQLRQIDFMLLEGIATSTLDTWRLALQNFGQNQASIFQLEVGFSSDGKVSLTPSLEDLTETIISTLHNSITVLNSLPRILLVKQLRAHMRQAYPNFRQLIQTGPSIITILKPYTEMNEIEDSINNIIKESYKEAQYAASIFADLYSIYILPSSWRATDLIKSRSDKPSVDINYVSGSLDYTIDFDAEPVVDLRKARADAELFLEYQRKLKELSPCSVAGCLYIESKMLREHLRPIPMEKFDELFEMLKVVLFGKEERITHMFNNFKKKLMTNPTSLPEYISLCTTIEAASAIVDNVKKEIKYTDDIFHMFVSYHVSIDSNSNQTNSLHTQFQQFTAAHESAIEIQKKMYQRFVDELTPRAARYEEKLRICISETNKMPSSIDTCNVKQHLAALEGIRQRIEELTPKIKTCIEYQKILKTFVSDFVQLQTIRATLSFANDLYDSIDQWNKIESTYLRSVFCLVDIDGFMEKIMQLESRANELMKAQTGDVALLNDLNNRLKTVCPYLTQIKQLSSKDMQKRHWDKLFEECGIKGTYRNEMRLDELLLSGVLEFKDKIEKMTDLAHGEEQLEKEFSEIHKKWNSIEIPVVPGQPKSDDNLLIKDVTPMIAQIEESVSFLTKMNSMPFALGVGDKVNQLNNQLQNVARVLREWWSFQGNWTFIRPLFTNDSNKQALQQQIHRFQWIRRKWSGVVRHAQNDLAVLSVCSFKDLAPYIKDCNAAAAALIESLDSFVEAKIKAVPRLYMLGSNDIIALSSLQSRPTIDRLISRLCMKIKNVIFAESSGTRMKILGLVGDDNSQFIFSKSLTLTDSIETWATQLFQLMKETIMDKISPAISKGGDRLSDWIFSYPSHIVSIVMGIKFTAETDKVFESDSNTQKEFTKFKEIIITRQNELARFISHTLSDADKIMAGMVMTILSNQITLCNRLAESSEPKTLWFMTPKYQYISSTNTLTIQYNGESVEFGGELWGKFKPEIYTHATERARQSIIFNQFPLLLGSPCLGRKLLIKSLAGFFGKPVFFAPAYPDFSLRNLNRIGFGTVSSGSWTVFLNTQMLQTEVTSGLFDFLTTFEEAKEAAATSMMFNSVSIPIEGSPRFMFTGVGTVGNLTQQLREILVPVALSSPDLHSILLVKFMACGFMQPEHPANKLESVTNIICSIYESQLHTRSTIHHCSKIVGIASRIRMNAKEKGVNFNLDSDRLFEEFVTAIATYKHFHSMLDDKYHDSLMTIIFNTFKSFDQLDKFSVMVKQPLRDRFDSLLSTITNIARSVIDLPYTTKIYLAEKVTRLFGVLRMHRGVILYGPPNSGKNTVLKALRDTMEMLEHNENFHDMIIPLHFHRVFHNSAKWGTIFGHTEGEGTAEEKWIEGTFRQEINQALKANDKKRHIFVFDGPITPEFNHFLGEFTKMKQSYTNSMDEFDFTDRMNIVVVTTNIDNLTPLTAASMAMLPVLQQFNGIDDLSSLPPPSIFPKDCLPVYNEFAPSAIQFVAKMPISSTPHANTESERFHILITLFPNTVACEVNGLIEEKLLNPDNEEEVMDSILIAASRFMLGFMEPKSYQLLDEWIKNSFKGHTDSDWSKRIIPLQFISTFSRPIVAIYSLRSRVYDLVNLSIFEKKHYRMIEGSTNPNDIIIPTPEMAVSLDSLKTHLNTKQPLLVVGSSGKKSLLRFMFYLDADKNYEPVCYKLSRSTSPEYLTTFIQEVADRFDGSSGKSLVLIFEHLDRATDVVQELIRSIMISKCVSTLSTISQNRLRTTNLENVILICTSKSTINISQRITAIASSIFVPEPSVDTLVHVISNVMIASDVAKQFIDKACDAFKACCTQIPSFKPSIREAVNLMRTVMSMKNRGMKLPSDELNLTSVLYNDFLFRRVGSNQDEVNKIGAIFMRYYKGFSVVINERQKQFVTEVAIGKNMEEIASGSAKDVGEMIETLNNYIFIFNSNAPEKLPLKFYSKNIKIQHRLERILMTTNGHVILNGPEGSGRFSLTRVTANICQFDFLNVASPIVDMDVAKKVVKDCISNAALHSKRCVIYFKTSLRENEEFVQMLIDFAQSGEFSAFFEESALKEFYAKIFDRCNVNHSYSQATEMIQKAVQINVHIVIATDSIECLPSTDGFLIEDFVEMDDDDHLEIANRYTLDEDNKTIIGSFSSLFPKLVVKILGVAKRNLKHIHQNMYFDFITIFNRTLVSEYNSTVSLTNTKNVALQMISKVVDEKRLISEKVNGKKPMVDQIRVSRDTQKLAYTSKHDAVTSMRAKIEKDKEEKLSHMNKMKRELTIAENEKKRLFRDVIATQTSVEKMGFNDIQTLRINGENPADVFIKTFEILCIYLHMHFSYEKGGVRLLNDDKLLSIVKAGIKYDQVDPGIIQLVMPYYDDEFYTHEEAEKVSPSLLNLYDWLHTITLYGKASLTHSNLQKQYNTYAEAFEKFNSDLVIQTKSMEQVEETLKGDMEKLNELEAVLEKAEADMEEFNQRLLTVMKVLDESQPIEDIWNDDVNASAKYRTRNIATSLLYAFFLAFCGQCNPSIKKKMLSGVSNEITSMRLSDAVEEPFQVVKEMLDYNGALTIPSEYGLFEFALPVLHGALSMKAPLVIDPDGLLDVYLSRVVDSSKLVVVSQYSSELQNTIVQAISLGSTLVIKDADFLSPYVSSILSVYALRNVKECSQVASVGSISAVYNHSFRLYLVTSKNSIKDIPQQLLWRCTLIKAKAEGRITAQRAIEGKFLEILDKNLYSKLMECQTTGFHLNVDIRRAEEANLEAFNAMSEAYQSGGIEAALNESLVEKVYSTRMDYLNAIKVAKETLELKGSLRSKIDLYSGSISNVNTFWRILIDKMSYIAPLSVTNLPIQNYLTTITSTLKQPGVLRGNITAEAMMNFDNVMTKTILGTILPSLNFFSSLAFLSLVALQSAVLKGQIQISDEKEIISHLAMQARAPFQESSVFMTGDPIMHLRTASSSNIYNLIERTITTRFGSDWITFISPFTPDVVLSQQSNIVTFLYGTQRSPVSEIRSYMQSRRNDRFEAVTLTESVNSLIKIRKTIMTAVVKGTRQIIYINHMNRDVFVLLADVMQHISVTNIHTNFRLVFCLNNVDFVPHVSQCHTRFISYEMTPLLRHRMTSLFLSCVSGIKQTTNPRALRRVSYAAAMTVGVLYQRNLLTPVGYSAPLDITNASMTRYIQAARQIIDLQSGSIPQQSLRDLFMDVFVGSRFVDSLDRRKVRALIFSVFSPTMFEDGNNYCGSSIEAKPFIMIGDSQTQAMTAHCQKMPTFAPPCAMLMAPTIATPLRAWNMSQMVAENFFKLSRVGEVAQFESDVQSVLNSAVFRAKQIPNTLSIPNIPIKNAMTSLLFSEIAAFNSLVEDMKERLQSLNDYSLLMGSGSVPSEWLERAHCYVCGDASSFIEFLRNKKSLLEEWREARDLKRIDVRLFPNVRPFLEAYLSDGCEKRGMSVGKNALSFDIGGVGQYGALALQNVSCVGCRFSLADGLVAVDSGTTPIGTLPDIIVTIGKGVRGHFYFFPLLRTIRGRISEVESNDGESKDLEFFIPLKSGVVQASLVSNSASFSCTLPPELQK